MPLTRTAPGPGLVSPLVQWRACRQAVLRMAGFGFDLLAGFDFSPTLAHLRERVGGKAAPGLADVFSQDLRAARRRLHAIAADLRFQEALLLSNPDAFERVDAYARRPFPMEPDSATRRVERLAATYLQRFCAKNESTSFFGPVAYARLDPCAETPLSGRFSGRLARRRVNCAHWAAQALARSAAPDAPAVPTLTWTPLDYLPAAAQPAGAEFTRNFEAFATAEDLASRRRLLRTVEQRFTDLTGLPPRRAAGLHYADRMLFSEECAYDAGDLRIAQNLIDPLIAPPAPLLSALTLPARLALAAHRRVFRDFCRHRWGRSFEVSLADVDQALATTTGLRATLFAQASTEWRRSVSSFIRPLVAIAEAAAREPGTPVDCNGALREMCRASGTADADGWPSIASCDVMIAAGSLGPASRDDYAVVLGELHHSVAVNGFYASVHSRPDELRQDLRTLIVTAASGREPVNVIAETRNKTYVGLDLGFRDVVIGGAALPDKRPLAASVLRIRGHGDSLELYDAGAAQPLFVYSSLPVGLGLYPLLLFGVPPCSTSTLTDGILARLAYLPRLMAGRVALTRCTWRVRRATLAAALDRRDRLAAFVAVQELRSRHRWPRYVFARLGPREKPLCIDLSNALLLDVLRHRLARATSERVDVSEMVPAPDELWLADVHGRHTSEVRLTFASTA